MINAIFFPLEFQFDKAIYLLLTFVSAVYFILKWINLLYGFYIKELGEGIVEFAHSGSLLTWLFLVLGRYSRFHVTAHKDVLRFI